MKRGCRSFFMYFVVWTLGIWESTGGGWGVLRVLEITHHDQVHDAIARHVPTAAARDVAGEHSGCAVVLVALPSAQMIAQNNHDGECSCWLPYPSDLMLFLSRSQAVAYYCCCYCCTAAALLSLPLLYI